MAKKTRAEQRLEKKKEAIAKRLKDTLAVRGFSQTQFAKLAEMRVSFVNRILRADTNLTLETICKLEEVLKLDLIFIPPSLDAPIPTSFVSVGDSTTQGFQ